VFPFIDTAPRAKPPVVVLGLIAANFAVFLWMQGLPPQTLEATLVHYALIPLRYTDPRLAVSVGLDPSNWMPMLTDMFMHGPGQRSAVLEAARNSPPSTAPRPG
jgi:membrane associated rhomboid family serine protease